mgnify:CR=1 FL=1
MSKPHLSQTNLLAQPLPLPNGAVLRNRLAKSSMSETLGSYDNHATPKLVALYKRWAASGIGLLLTGNVMIDRRALGEPGNVVIEDEADLPILRQWARAARSASTRPGKCPSSRDSVGQPRDRAARSEPSYASDVRR